MKRKSFAQSPCSIARSLDVLGDWWNPLILRECLYGNRRFDELQYWLGISRNILTLRLTDLVDQGLLEKHAYQSNPQRFEYNLTDQGFDACEVLLVLLKYGETWCFKPGKQPIDLYSRTTGRKLVPMVVDAESGEEIDPRDVVAAPGPGFKAPKRIVDSRFADYFATVSTEQ